MEQIQQLREPQRDPKDTEAQIRLTDNGNLGGGGGIGLYADHPTDDNPRGIGWQETGTPSLVAQTPTGDDLLGWDNDDPDFDWDQWANQPLTPQQGEPVAGLDTGNPSNRGPSPQPTDPQTQINQPVGEMGRTGPNRHARAAIRIASININGGGSTASEKWEHVNQLMRDERVDVLTIQETHLTQDALHNLQERYPRIQIYNTADPESPSTRGGVAVVVNKYSMNWKENKVHTVIEGRAVLLQLLQKNDKYINILAVYAPSGRATENREFWENLHTEWTNRRNLPDVDIMLGDLNMVESSMDRIPAKPGDAQVIEALRVFRDAHGLVDGWRLENPDTIEYTFATTKRNEANSRSRIDRIYVTDRLLDRCREWCIRHYGIRTDHKMISVQVTPIGAPEVGPGRSTIPTHLMEDKQAVKALLTTASRYETRIQNSAGQNRTDGENPQSIWSEMKRELLKTATTHMRMKITALDKNTKDLQRRRAQVLGSTTGAPEEETSLQLDEIDQMIKANEIAKVMRMRDKVAAHHHLEGETLSKFDYEINKLKRPRDTIDALQLPGSNPPQYTSRANEMLDIAIRYHDKLQTEVDNCLTPNQRDARVVDVLSRLKPRLTRSEYADLDMPLSRDEISTALKEVPNDKAPGLDGIPIELWKMFQARYESTKNSEQPTFDVLGVLETVINDIEMHGVAHNTGFADGWMCPLYKKKARTDIANYRPITVLNTDYKVMTRALSNRLSEVAPIIIHEDQAGFMKGRSIYDQTDLLHVAMKWCEEKEIDGVVVCLDQEKAYDKIQHDFLWKSLEKLGFPPRFIDTIKGLYKEAWTSIIINGFTSAKYRIIRGVRQGDPLSCLLFNIAIESLAELIRSSSLEGIHIPEVHRTLKVRLFADDTTVYLKGEDDTNILFALLEEWCQASGARFNIEKTVLIPLGTPQYRNHMTQTRTTNEMNDPIPEGIHVLNDGEHTRVLGSFFGYNLKQADIWQPTVEKVGITLKRWSQFRPTILGRGRSASAIVGSFTQYLTRVQGMPPEVETKLNRMVDDFVWAKKGERKSNTINLETLQQPRTSGGLGLLDLKARNNAIELMKLQVLLKPDHDKPLWARMAELMIRETVTSGYRLVHKDNLTNPFIQRWKAFANSPKLSSNLQRMLKAADSANAQHLPIGITQNERLDLPFWYHLHQKQDARTLYNDTWGSCHRRIHAIRTTGQMLDHADKNRFLDHDDQDDCDCVRCHDDRRDGCANPIKCRIGADRKLDTIAPEWDPRTEPQLRPSCEEEPTLPGEQQGDEIVRYGPDYARGEPSSVVRAPVKWKKGTKHSVLEIRRDVVHSTRWDVEETTVYTDGSCHGNGTENAKAGSGIWYASGDARNRSIRVPDHYASNNAGELLAILEAIRENKRSKILTIYTDSKYCIDAIAKHLPRWWDEGFVHNSNVPILKALYQEILSSRTTIRLRKVKGHSGDAGNDGADRLANEGAHKEPEEIAGLQQVTDSLDMGIRLATATQSTLYKALRAVVKATPRPRSERNLDLIQNALEEANGEKPHPRAIWSSTTTNEAIGKRARAFIWKAIHDGHKIGSYWRHTDLADRFMPCDHCSCDVESLHHILFECEASSQRHVWEIFEEIWLRNGEPKPFISIGLALGISLATIRDAEGKVKRGPTRLFQILVSESIHLIWVLRCQWRIEFEGDASRIHTRDHVRNRWLASVNKRLRWDRTLANERTYGRKALKPKLVEATWCTILDERTAGDLPPGWVLDKGVLVGVGRTKRPPGRNR